MTNVLLIAVGVLAGVILTALGVVYAMRTRMVVAHPSRRSFEDTCAAIERVIPANKGWGFPIPSWNFYETFVKKNLVPKGLRKLRVFFVCKSALASRVIADTPPMAGIMPCSWAVYEKEDGSVWLSKMNIGLMAMMFSGAIREAMSEVARMDRIFLDEVLNHPERGPVGEPQNEPTG